MESITATATASCSPSGQTSWSDLFVLSPSNVQLYTTNVGNGQAVAQPSYTLSPAYHSLIFNKTANATRVGGLITVDFGVAYVGWCYSNAVVSITLKYRAHGGTLAFLVSVAECILKISCLFRSDGSQGTLCAHCFQHRGHITYVDVDPASLHSAHPRVQDPHENGQLRLRGLQREHRYARSHRVNHWFDRRPNLRVQGGRGHRDSCESLQRPKRERNSPRLRCLVRDLR